MCGGGFFLGVPAFCFFFCGLLEALLVPRAGVEGGEGIAIPSGRSSGARAGVVAVVRLTSRN